jgi:DNA-binding GntR family transcriptional regulator
MTGGALAEQADWNASDPVWAEPDDVKTDGRKGFRHQDAVCMLRRLIQLGELAPGERLREVAISQRLGMSRTPVREAFRTLAAEGLVELLPNRSVVVSEIDRSEAGDVMSVLGLLESFAAGQASERITEQELAQLGSLQEDLERYYGNFDRENYVRTNRRIHEVIVEASRNSALIVAWRAILPRAERACSARTMNRNRWTEAVYEHRMIFTALVNRDTARISDLMGGHIRNGLAALSGGAAASGGVAAE